jgi:type II secretory pathway pseudopilin PulG
MQTMKLYYRKRRGGGFSYMEMLVSAVIISVLLVAGLRLSGNLARSQQGAVELDNANRLTLLLIEEMKGQAYTDPQQPSNFGREGDETAANRSGFDDLDDYANWVKQPPDDSSGRSLSQYPDLSREVQVRFVAANNFTQTVTTDQGFKAVTITVRRGNRIVTQNEYVFANVKWTPN